MHLIAARDEAVTIIREGDKKGHFSSLLLLGVRDMGWKSPGADNSICLWAHKWIYTTKLALR